MDRYLDFLFPARGRVMALWFAFGTALFTIVTSVCVALWADILPALFPTVTVQAAVGGPLAIVLLVIEFAIVYAAVSFARHGGAPRWIWVPVAALAAWVSLASLVGYALTEALQARDVVEVLYSILFGVSSLPAIALPALLACARTGRPEEPLLGDFGDQPALFAMTGAVVVAVGVPMTALIQGWLAGMTGVRFSLLGVPLSGTILFWTALVPGLACWIGTSRFGLPRSIWLPAAIGGLWIALSAFTPVAWFRAPAQSFSSMLVYLLLAVLAAAASIVGSWYGTREERPVPQPRAAT